MGSDQKLRLASFMFPPGAHLGGWRMPDAIASIDMDFNHYVNLARLSAAGSPEIIDQANDGTWSPAFAPDGTLAMASNRAGEQGIWLMRPGACWRRPPAS